MKHIHAELMMEYAKDAMETDKPWERWEYKYQIKTDWSELFSHPAWADCIEYRRKPITININGFEVPEPVRDYLQEGQEYYIPGFYEGCISDESVMYIWSHDAVDISYFEKGFIHLTKESAELHHRAILSFTKKG